MPSIVAAWNLLAALWSDEAGRLLSLVCPRAELCPSRAACQNLCVCVSIYASISIYIYLSSTYLSFLYHLSTICLLSINQSSVHPLSIHLSVIYLLFVHPFICPSVYHLSIAHLPVFIALWDYKYVPPAQLNIGCGTDLRPSCLPGEPCAS